MIFLSHAANGKQTLTPRTRRNQKLAHNTTGQAEKHHHREEKHTTLVSMGKQCQIFQNTSVELFPVTVT